MMTTPASRPAPIASPVAPPESPEAQPVAPADAPARESRQAAWGLGGLALHLVLTAFFTWPLLGDLLTGANQTPGFMVEDRDQNLWNLWWVKTALLDQHTNPLFTNFIYWPDGVSLQFHTLNIFNGLISIPFQPFLPLPVIYNGIVYASFALGGWGAYLLIAFLLRRQVVRAAMQMPGAVAAAAAVGSSIFTYSAYHIATQRGLLQLISLEWVPFYVLFLLRAVALVPGRGDWRIWGRWLLRFAVPGAFFLLLVALVDWYYVMYALLLTALYGLYLLWNGLRGARVVRRHSRPRQERWEGTRAASPARMFWGQGLAPILGIGLVVGLFLVVVSPWLLSMFHELSTADYMRPAPGIAVADSADLLTFFIPPQFQHFWGVVSTFRAHWPFGSNQYEVYLGYVALGLAGIGLFWRRRSMGANTPERGGRLPSRAFWAVSALIFGLLALGPVLQVNGLQYPDVQPMPYALIEHIPGFNISRSPDRFAMPLMLCLGVLAGWGVFRLATGLSARRLPRLGPEGTPPRLLAGGLLALLAFELWPAPFPQLPAPIPAYFGTLAQDPGDYAILELPREDSYWHGAFRMYFQTAHGKRIFYGYISREYYHPFLFSTPGFMELQNPDGLPDLFADGPAEWLTALAQYNTRYIVLYKAGWRPRPPADETAQYQAELAKVIGADAVAHPVHSDADMDVYRVPVPATPVPYLSLGDGWERREATPQESHRWMHNDATLRLDSPHPFHAVLVFDAVPLGPARTLTVRRDGGAPVTLTIDGRASSYRVDLGTVPAGASTISLSSPGPLLSPKELGMSQDSRYLGLSFSQVRVEQAP